MTDLSAIKVRIRKRWWVAPLLAVAPRALTLVSHASPRAAVAGLNHLARVLESRALIIEVVDRKTRKPLRPGTA